MLFDWQFFAGQYAAATIDAHLAAIREFEEFTGGAGFRTLTIKSVDAYRQHLSERANLHHGEDALSRSSVRHKASHVKAFLAWLLNQSGYRRLPRDLADYLTLSRALNAQTLAPQPKGHPTMEAAIEMALGMPASSLQERRDQAIVAMAFVTGLRAGALSTLRLEHIDCTERTATQDGTLMRAKNGKNYVADWFATTEPLQGIVVAWIEELTQLGFEAKDAVFPAVRELTAQEPSLTSSRRAVPTLKSEGAITKAFAVASQVAGTSYTPHCARHTLTALGNRLCTNRVEEKAWSKNLGHANVQTTESNYAKLTDDEKQSVLRTIGQGSSMTSDDKDLCLDYHEHRLSPGTPEFLRAKDLIAERARKREG
ncbi:tyrosine-type recombinase/integrase [Falsihalocynthiibacter sp. CO-5D18]|uniref:tyrosine-type recombinase/integrase n=1 Tax=Falsihalocynthiibacter sp. CO-5D18 TaxID=3240872 RepID=UPI003510AC6D